MYNVLIIVHLQNVMPAPLLYSMDVLTHQGFTLSTINSVRC